MGPITLRSDYASNMLTSLLVAMRPLPEEAGKEWKAISNCYNCRAETNQPCEGLSGVLGN